MALDVIQQGRSLGTRNSPKPGTIPKRGDICTFGDDQQRAVFLEQDGGRLRFGISIDGQPKYLQVGPSQVSTPGKRINIKNGELNQYISGEIPLTCSTRSQGVFRNPYYDWVLGETMQTDR
jgi:hypothetical protein